MTDLDVLYGAALALALKEDAGRPERLADDLNKRFPEHTIVQSNYLPTLRAQIALNRNDAAKAIEVLLAATRYELGDVGHGSLYPVYARGQAYLVAYESSKVVIEDFTRDTLASGVKFRTLNLMDGCTREALWIEVDTSLPGPRVVRDVTPCASAH